MPYIRQDKRDEVFTIDCDDDGNQADINLEYLGFAVGECIDNMGDLNFLLSTAIARYLEINGKNYQNCNDIMGMFESCKSEFYRRIVAPYEDEKIEENGDCHYEILEDSGVIGIVDIETEDKY